MGFVFVLSMRRYTEIPECEKYPDIDESRTLSTSFLSTHLRIVMVFIFNKLQII